MNNVAAHRHRDQVKMMKTYLNIYCIYIYEPYIAMDFVYMYVCECVLGVVSCFVSYRFEILRLMCLLWFGLFSSENFNFISTIIFIQYTNRANCVLKTNTRNISYHCMYWSGWSTNTTTLGTSTKMDEIYREAVSSTLKQLKVARNNQCA